MSDSRVIPLPRWVWIALASGGGVVLVLGAIALIVSLPVLTKVAGSQRSLERVNSIDRDVAAIRSELGELQALDGIGHSTSAIPRKLTAVNGGLAGVQGDVGRTVGQIAALRTELAPLERQAPQLRDLVTELGAVQRDLRQLSGLATVPRQLDALSTNLRAIRRNTHTLTDVPRELRRLVTVLRRVERHVRNLDEKTGPVLLHGRSTAG